MTAYAVADLHNVKMGPAIVEYLEKFDATLAPFGGRYIVHGGAKTVLEGEWPGDIVIVAFPDRESARAWYASPAYRAIAALRTDNSDGDVVLVDGVADGHRATDILG
ncbi:MAG: DUF1330 domain-containing protein [Kiloniellaceae bacterium]